MKTRNSCSVILACALSLGASAINSDGGVFAKNNPDQKGVVAAPAKLKIKGRVVKRQGDVVTLKTLDNQEVNVLLAGATEIKSKGGFLASGKNFDPNAMLVGLRLEVEGVKNEQDQVVARKIRFKESDLEVAKSVETRVVPVEERVGRVESANEELASQVDELSGISKTLRADIDTTRVEMTDMNKRIGERISALDDYDVKESTTVYFKVNKADLLPEGKAMLDTLAEKITGNRGYLIEISGYTDISGSVEQNRELSRRRADEVVRYLAETHNVPLRRMITPFGYGSERAAADNATPEGRELNRRVEVRILVNRAEIAKAE